MVAKKSPLIIDWVQIALFPNDLSIAKPGLFGSELVRATLVTQDNLIVNHFLTDSAPSGLVRVEAKGRYQDKNIKIQISKDKINLFWKNSDAQEDFSVTDKDLSCLDKLLSMDQLTKIRYRRIGYITTIFKKIDAPISVIKKMLSNDHQDITEGQLILTYKEDRLNKTIRGKNVIYNKHCTISTGQLNADNTGAVIVQHDLNTRQDQELKLTREEVVGFVKNAMKYSTKDQVIKGIVK